MKIHSVKLTPIRTPRHTGAAYAHVLVEMHSDEGLTGYGEMSDLSHLPYIMPDVRALEASLNKVLVGLDPRQFAVLEHTLAANFGAGSITGQTRDKTGHIRAGIDIAAHDLAGKYYGVPVSNLLGGRFRERVKVCYPIFRQRNLGDVDINLARVAHFHALGFDVFRVYVGGDFEADEAFLAGLRSRFGSSVTVKSLDFSAQVHWKDAVSFAKRMMPYGFAMVESPARGRDPVALREVRRQLELPVSEHIGGMRSLLELIKHEAIDIANISVTQFGGLTPARRAFEVCEAANLRCLIGTTQELSLATAAQGHLAASVPDLPYPCDPTGPHVYTADIAVEPVRYEEGYLLVPDAPGIGIEVDEEKLEALTAPLGWDDAPPQP